MRTMPTGPYNSSAPNYAVEASFAEQPFGDNKQTFPGTATSFDTDANHYAFLDTDKETATDHADFRQYSNAQGRWMAPDPYDGSYNRWESAELESVCVRGTGNPSQRRAVRSTSVCGCQPQLRSSKGYSTESFELHIRS
jgi:hypothetical protein